MAFEYVQPDSLAEATAVLSREGIAATVIAGGTELMLRIRLRETSPRLVVSIGYLPELQGIAETEPGGLRIGAGVTLAQLSADEHIRARFPAIASASAATRSPQFRTLATVGGALATRAGTAEVALPLIALDARLRAVSAFSSRWVYADQLQAGDWLRASEIVDRIELRGPTDDRTRRNAYARICRRGALELPLIACAIALDLRPNGECATARVVVGIATPTPQRLITVETLLTDHQLTEIDRDELAAACQASAPTLRDDVRASRAYRERLVPIVVGRALDRLAKNYSSGPEEAE